MGGRPVRPRAPFPRRPPPPPAAPPAAAAAPGCMMSNADAPLHSFPPGTPSQKCCPSPYALRTWGRSIMRLSAWKQAKFAGVGS